jgi:hypothetical protein
VATGALDITKNIDDPTKVIRFEGPVNIDKSVKLIRVAAIYVQHGNIGFDGTKGSTKVEIAEVIIDDPRDLAGLPTDAFHLGGISGHIGLLRGTGLQRDLAKVGKGANGLMVDHSIGEAVAMELKPDMDPDHIPHQDGWQIMNGWNITINQLDYTGGPDTQHAAFFCNPGGPGGDETNSKLIHDCVVLSGTIITKATGIALGACTRCGTKNMTITAKYPWRIDKQRTKQPIDVNNKKVAVRDR